MAKPKKGMVVQLVDQYAVVLTAQGTFEKTKIPKTGCHIGDEIAIEKKILSSISEVFWAFRASLKPTKRLGAALGAFCVMAFGVISWASPVGYVYMDVNPSLAIGYNLYERVVSYESFNEDGAVIKDSVSVYGKSIEDTVEVSLLVMNEKGFVKEEASGLILGFTSDSETVREKTIQAVTKAVDKTQKSIEVGSVRVDKGQVTQAKNLKATPIEVAIATEKSGKDSPVEKVAEAVENMKNKTTAEVIKGNTSVNKVKNEKLEEIKKAIALKKAKQKEQVRPREDKQKAPLKNQVQETVKDKVKETIKDKVKEKASSTSKDVEKPLIKADPKKTPALKTENMPQNEPPKEENKNAEKSVQEDLPMTEEEQMNFADFEMEKGADAENKLEKLHHVKKNLEALREKLTQSNLPEKEKNKRLEQVNKQLLKVNALIRRFENKKK